MSDPGAQDLERERRWRSWLVERNRKSAFLLEVMVLVFYPFFALLDWAVAPPQWLWLLWGSRALVTGATLAALPLTRSRLFDRHFGLVTSSYLVLVAGGVALMVHVMGGFGTDYYVGLIVVMLGGILFLWPSRLAALVNFTVVASLVVPNLPTALDDLGATLKAVFFTGTSAAILSIVAGFSYRSQREQVIAQLELERTTANLEQAHLQLQELDRFKSQVFANITHELKTPLAMILASVELALVDEGERLGEQLRGSLQAMFRNALKLLRLIGDILDISRLDESRIRLRVDEHDFVAYLRALMAQVEPLAQRKNIEARFESNLETCPLWCDLDRMERVFINLLSNAAKFTPEGGRITVRLVDEGEGVLVEVEDTGPGFEPALAERLFERFFQADMGSARRFGGTGIGLALARELVELHDGTVTAEGRPEQGATFRVRLPKGRDHFRSEVLDRRQARHDPRGGGQRAGDRGLAEWTGRLTEREDLRLQEIAEATERRIAERDPEEAQRSHTLLVVDDTPDILRVVSLTLRGQFRVFTADDGLKGLDLALRLRPSLIITDLMMPGIDGLELVRRLRAEPSTQQIPIVMLSARGDLEDRVLGLETGAIAYLAKPFSPRELRGLVRSLLDLEDTHAETQLHRRIEALDTLAAGMAHEMNNALNQVRPSLLLLASSAQEALALVPRPGEPPPSVAPGARCEKLRGRVEKMSLRAEAGLARIAATVELLGSYAREGYARTERPHDLFEGMRSVAAVVQPSLARAVALDLDLPGAAWVRCVPEEIHQLLTNLLQNALEAAPEPAGHVWVSGRCDDGWVTLRVRDDGPGIPDDLRERVFEPFFSTKAPGHGMGLGLTISWRVAQRHGGSLLLEAPELGGAAFVLRLPLVAPEGGA